ncbi:MAG: glycosyltransferase [Flavobacteriales bacterium]
MKLSVIIVNYNVEAFLEQCLRSVLKALDRVDGEVIVVDNASVDGSVEMVREEFPSVHLIANQQNLGFSKANDQAIEFARGEYVLLLNPDTLVEEDSFEKVIAFMDEHPEAGGLGVKMLDGQGRFLPESKRALPTPEVAFYKVFGLSALFPRSKRFGKYHLGHLDKDKVHEIEVLSGAFMLLRRSALDDVGYLDTSFFMYGEDIDLSYRLLQGGYRNYYYPHTRIIHYKGESTKKSSINYVIVFYKAMLIFADKHFSKKNRWLFRGLIRFAIYFRAFLAILSRGFRRIALPLMDGLFTFGGTYLIQEGYEAYKGFEYPEVLVLVALASYSAVWMLAVLFSGGYDRPIRKRRVLRGVLWGSVIILIGYSLLPETYRFSRAITLMSAFWACLVFLGLRWAFAFFGVYGDRSGMGEARRVAVVGTPEEGERIGGLLERSRQELRMAGVISLDPEQGAEKERSILGNVERLSELIDVHRIDELIFAARDVPPQRMIDIMAHVDYHVEHKVAPPESLYVIGSSSVDTSGGLHMLDINSISRPENRRNKRVLDLLLAFLFFFLSPLLLPFIRSKGGLFRNIGKVVRGDRTWVGYCEKEGKGREGMPKIPPGVLDPSIGMHSEELGPERVRKLNVIYAKDYRVRNDLKLLYKGVRELGRRSGARSRKGG